MLYTGAETKSEAACAEAPHTASLPMRVRTRRSGSAAMEAALIFLPFFAITLAIIDFSVAIFIKNTLTNAVREGTRYGVTSRTSGGLLHDASIKAVVQRFSFGFMNGTTNANRIGITYFNPTTGVFETGVGSNRAGNILEVRVAGYPWLWMAPVLRTRTTLHFGAESSDVMEPQPNGIPNR